MWLIINYTHLRILHNNDLVYVLCNCIIIDSFLSKHLLCPF